MICKIDFARQAEQTALQAAAEASAAVQRIAAERDPINDLESDFSILLSESRVCAEPFKDQSSRAEMWVSLEKARVSEEKQAQPARTRANSYRCTLPS